MSNLVENTYKIHLHNAGAADNQNPKYEGVYSAPQPPHTNYETSGIPSNLAPLMYTEYCVIKQKKEWLESMYYSVWLANPTIYSMIYLNHCFSSCLRLRNKEQIRAIWPKPPNDIWSKGKFRVFAPLIMWSFATPHFGNKRQRRQLCDCFGQTLCMPGRMLLSLLSAGM